MSFWSVAILFFLPGILLIGIGAVMTQRSWPRDGECRSVPRFAIGFATETSGGILLLLGLLKLKGVF